MRTCARRSSPSLALPSGLGRTCSLCFTQAPRYLARTRIGQGVPRPARCSYPRETRIAPEAWSSHQTSRCRVGSRLPARLATSARTPITSHTAIYRPGKQHRRLPPGVQTRIRHRPIRRFGTRCAGADGSLCAPTISPWVRRARCNRCSERRQRKQARHSIGRLVIESRCNVGVQIEGDACGGVTESLGHHLGWISAWSANVAWVRRRS